MPSCLPKHPIALLPVFVIMFLVAVHAQESPASLSGTVSDSSGKPAANVQVSAKSSTGQVTQAQTDNNGHYSFANLAPGEYDVTASAEGNGTASQHVTLTSGTPASANLTLAQGQAGAGQNLPNAPAPNNSEPSLSDLGFSASETQADAKRQALLDKRTHMLKIHQRMGLITTIPLIASVVTSLNAGGRSEGSAARDLHVALGALTGDLYGITAYYAIRAPRIEGTQTRGQIKAHKILAWVHGPGMILTPILGAMAFSQKNNGERVHGIASAHGPVAIVTAGAFGAALLTVSVKF